MTPTPVPDEQEEVPPIEAPGEATRPSPVGAEDPYQAQEHVGRKIPDEETLDGSEEKGAIDSVLQSLVDIVRFNMLNTWIRSLC